jgi:hypothetical protein
MDRRRPATPKVQRCTGVLGRLAGSVPESEAGCYDLKERESPTESVTVTL